MFLTYSNFWFKIWTCDVTESGNFAGFIINSIACNSIFIKYISESADNNKTSTTKSLKYFLINSIIWANVKHIVPFKQSKGGSVTPKVNDKDKSTLVLIFFSILVKLGTLKGVLLKISESKWLFKKL